MIVAFLSLIGKLFWLQLVRGDEYRVRAEDNYLKEVRIPADRGLIVDRNHVVLVDQRPSFDVTLTPNYCGSQCEAIIDRLAVILGMTRRSTPPPSSGSPAPAGRGTRASSPSSSGWTSGARTSTCWRRCTRSCRAWTSSRFLTATTATRGSAATSSAT